MYLSPDALPALHPPRRRHCRRPLPARGGDRAGRCIHGLPGRGPEVRPQGGHQGAPPGAGLRAPAVPPRDPHRGAALPPADPAAARFRRVRARAARRPAAPVLRHALRRLRDSPRPAHSRRPAPDGRRAPDHPGGRRRRSATRTGSASSTGTSSRRTSCSMEGEPVIADFGVATARLGGGRGRRVHHRSWLRRRHSGLHEPRAGQRGARTRRTLRPVQPGLRAVRDARRAIPRSPAPARAPRWPATRSRRRRSIGARRPNVPAAIERALARALAKSAGRPLRDDDGVRRGAGGAGAGDHSRRGAWHPARGPHHRGAARSSTRAPTRRTST